MSSLRAEKSRRLCVNFGGKSWLRGQSVVSYGGTAPRRSLICIEHQS